MARYVCNVQTYQKHYKTQLGGLNLQLAAKICPQLKNATSKISNPLRPMLMAFMFLVKIFQNIDEGGRSSLSIMPLFLGAK